MSTAVKRPVLRPVMAGDRDHLQKTIAKALHEYFGFSGFRGRQEDIIISLLEGHNVFVIMPTGGGKSLTYQLPALVAPGTAVIISPLIALMKNQVDNIRSYGEQENIAHFLNSSLTKKQIEVVRNDILQGNAKMVYLAPETLTKDTTIELLRQIKVSFVAVDEAHCISEWGHDFRPEYRNIRNMVDAIGNVPIIALTASATPKVQDDILKTLKIKNARIFIDSFNRPNLYYEVRPKVSKLHTIRQILEFIRQRPNQSGITYCLNRKTTTELADILVRHGISALPYHAGLMKKNRHKHQDMFLMEEVNVMVATIAFGLGIDKPDIRYIIHYDIPKSLESYYQETGRAGRDGLPSHCLLFYDLKDVDKFEHFLYDKPYSEREIQMQMLEEMANFAETAICRRKYLLRYFGEAFDEADCHEQCDNCRHPKPTVRVKDEVVMALGLVRDLPGRFRIRHFVDILSGRASRDIAHYKHHQLDIFGKGKAQGPLFWNSLYRYLLVHGYLEKEIENYGTLHLTENARQYLTHPVELEIAINRDMESPEEASPVVSGGAADERLFKMLQALRKKIAHQKGVPPYVIFPDPVLEEMSLYYPTTDEELLKIQGVSRGKLAKYGQPFLQFIAEYLEEYDLEKPTEIAHKKPKPKSRKKILLIQSIDRKTDLEDLASMHHMNMEDLLDEIEEIVTERKIDISYYIDNVIEPEAQEEIFEYFRTADDDSPEKALEALGEDLYTLEEIRLMRIKFLSEYAH